MHNCPSRPLHAMGIAALVRSYVSLMINFRKRHAKLMDHASTAKNSPPWIKESAGLRVGGGPYYGPKMGVSHNNGNVRARAPYLGCLLHVPTPSEHILPRWGVLWHAQDVDNADCERPLA